MTLSVIGSWLLHSLRHWRIRLAYSNVLRRDPLSNRTVRAPCGCGVVRCDARGMGHGTLLPDCSFDFQ